MANSVYSRGMGVCGGGCGVFPLSGDPPRCPKCHKQLRLSKRNKR